MDEPTANPAIFDGEPTAGWLNTLPERMAQQFSFLMEAERLRGVLRRSPALRGARRENAAEHSWQLALFAAVLADWANAPIRLDRVLTMLLIHDIVEIDAGDVSLFDEDGRATQIEPEARAADRLFAFLPEDQAEGFHTLWGEFERGDTDDARFARALDRLQPIVLNHMARGGTWVENDVDIDRERRLTGHIADGSDPLWQAAEAIFAEAVASGWMRASRSTTSQPTKAFE